MTLELREETADDVLAVHALHAAAFETDAEARLVDALRASGALRLALVAVSAGEVLGHIAFSPVIVESAAGTIHGIGLAPVAVAPAHQRRGIGGRLIADGLQRLRGMGEPFCVVLGHREYYPRHGFVKASAHGIRWEKPVPEEVFFVQELATGGLRDVHGIVRYRLEFDAL